ncbi:rhomboid family intramembrane serine protease [Diaminobutyricibacter tongyongensis]|uniref:Rhomboid family intramembrane serine protease n=1 Tax=Leifsonia tongyongensis TaxID=1268043 RepID=A0A6L9XV30_9MICO|nr:rhomboid family intramembrane serine protease [Diaminobutyricibacter tongyongensis]NEN05282.1 rhomboid family intramembrane serine protease [Diaminobutyricibacter tongyongensis]
MTQPADTRATYCYRHPDRQSYVLCQRCGRTICPECQTPAPVGVICPECMKQQRAEAPRVKPAVITRMTGRGAPVVTYSIIAICVFVFILQSLPGIGNTVTSAIWYAGAYSYPQQFEPWRMLTSVFAHGSILHIALNMYTFWIFGTLLEPLLGRVRFLLLFLLSGFAGSVGVLLLAPPGTPVLGASGAIFGLLGAFLVIQRRLGGNATQLLILVGINLVIGFIPGFNVAWQAHVGGLIAGALIGLIYVETRSPERRNLQIGLMSLLTLILLGLSTIHLFA